MIKKLYIHNYRCFENFEFSTEEKAVLLIGKNGSGKSTIRDALGIFQKIGRQINNIDHLLSKKDFSKGRINTPIRFELEVLIKEQIYKYNLAFELPKNFSRIRILEENLLLDNEEIFTRKEAQVILYRQKSQSQFVVDWHLIALPLIHSPIEVDPLSIFKKFLSDMVLLLPIPSQIGGYAKEESLQLTLHADNFAEWLSGILTLYPAAYSLIYDYLKKGPMPDIQDFRGEREGKDSKNWKVTFSNEKEELSVDFESLSEGEKIYFICATLIAANKFYGPIFCFWDEPDNYILPSEIKHLITELKKSFNTSGQIWISSHDILTIEAFSSNNTFVLRRKSHIEPVRIKLLEEIKTYNVSDSVVIGDIFHE